MWLLVPIVSSMPSYLNVAHSPYVVDLVEFDKFSPKRYLKNLKLGSTEIWTRIAGFKVQSANHYTIEPHALDQNVNYLNVLATAPLSFEFSHFVQSNRDIFGSLKDLHSLKILKIANASYNVCKYNYVNRTPIAMYYNIVIYINHYLAQQSQCNKVDACRYMTPYHQAYLDTKITSSSRGRRQGWKDGRVQEWINKLHYTILGGSRTC